VATVTDVLTGFDDYPIHQTSQPIAHPASSDPNHYDRYFFNGYTSSGSLYFALGMGLYPNRSVHDAAFCVVRGGEQISVYASGRAPADRMKANVVGPIEVRIIEPLNVLQLLINAPEQGVRAELTFRSRTAVLEEPHFFMRAGTKVVFDYTRLTQMGRWEGWVEVDGERIEVSPSEVFGSRDRSWGIRPCGERVTVPPPTALPQFFWLWAPLNFPNFATHFDVNEYADGKRWHEVAAWLPASDGTLPDGSPTEPVFMRHADHQVSWKPGTRHMENFELTFHDWDDSVATLKLEPIMHFQMTGIGYGHPEFNHGSWRGERVATGERLSIPVSEPLDPRFIHVQTLSKATFTHSSGQQEVGCGILETLAVGPHTPTGLSGIFDGAPY
jgi:hypothetical protein